MKKIDFAAIAIESAGLAAGGTAAMFAYKQLPKMLGSVAPKWVPFIVLGAGAFAPRFLGKKNELLLNVGRGMVARAGSDIMANALGLSDTVSGIGEIEMPWSNERSLYNYNQLAQDAAVAGVAGIDEQRAVI